MPTGLSVATLNKVLGQLAESHTPYHHSFLLQWPQDSLSKATWDLVIASISFTKAVSNLALGFLFLPKAKVLCPHQGKDRNLKPKG